MGRLFTREALIYVVSIALLTWLPLLLFAVIVGAELAPTIIIMASTLAGFWLGRFGR